MPAFSFEKLSEDPGEPPGPEKPESIWQKILNALLWLSQGYVVIDRDGNPHTTFLP